MLITPANVFWTLIWALAICLLFLIVAGIIVADVAFIKKSPWIFVGELLMFSVIPSIALSMLAYTRTRKMSLVVRDFSLLVVKFAIFHILLQVSGFYTFLYSFHSTSS